MYTLGINASFHDSSACLVKDGVVIAAAEDERFTHFKHGKRPIPFTTFDLPYHAIDYCLKEAGIELADIDHIAYGYDPHILLDLYKKEGVDLFVSAEKKEQKHFWFTNYPNWDALFLGSILRAPQLLVDNFPHHLQKRFVTAKKKGKFKWHFVDHHLAHAASAFLPSPYTNAAIMTLDGRGEIATTTYSVGSNNDIKRIEQVNVPNSLGVLYEEFTDYLGFLRSSDEYKVMALASYGKPIYKKQIQALITIKANGQYEIKPHDLVQLFGPKRLKGAEIEQKLFDLAHSLQLVVEETVVELANWLYKETKEENLCMAGGVALNCVMNARVRDNTPFKNIWVQPAAGDAGVALGAATWIDNKNSEFRVQNSELSTQDGSKKYVMNDVYLGPEFSDDEIEEFLQWTKVPYRKVQNVAEETAKILAEDKIIGWMQGRMEFGPRALGDRSLLASPIHADMQAKLNNIKDREDFRPVAPVVLEEDAGQYFKKAAFSPFMLFIYDVNKDAEKKIPAVRHVDGTARIQTINRSQNEKYYDVLSEFKKLTGVSVLINTSFNTCGEPIVCTPRDAVECFWTSPLDALIIGSFILEKGKR